MDDNPYPINTKYDVISPPDGGSIDLNQRSIELGKLTAALCKTQLEMGKAAKSSKNPFFNSSYADLNTCFNACRDALGSNGIAITQYGVRTKDGWQLKTMLLHISGQYLSGMLPLILGTKKNMQEVGSAVTYARRFALCSMVGLAQEDDDGNSISRNVR